MKFEAGFPLPTSHFQLPTSNLLNMSPWRRRLALVAINVMVFVVCAELLALVVYYEQTGRLFYTYRKPLPVIEETAQGALTADALHPYFGPIHRPGVRQETNNIGFGSTRNYPF